MLFRRLAQDIEKTTSSHPETIDMTLPMFTTTLPQYKFKDVTGVQGTLLQPTRANSAPIQTLDAVQ